jgi:hypothetical protein
MGAAAVPSVSSRSGGMRIGYGCTCSRGGDAMVKKRRCVPRPTCEACVQRALTAPQGLTRLRDHSAVYAEDALAVALAKRKTAPPSVTPAFVQSLCEPHLAPSVVEGSTGALLPNRSALPMDHRCRCSTNLMELATRVHKAMNTIELEHWDALSNLKKQVALAKAVSQEWASAFGEKNLTPADVARELECLKRKNEDLQSERRAMLRQQELMKLQVDGLMQQLHRQGATLTDQVRMR